MINKRKNVEEAGGFPGEAGTPCSQISAMLPRQCQVARLTLVLCEVTVESALHLGVSVFLAYPA